MAGSSGLSIGRPDLKDDGQSKRPKDIEVGRTVHLGLEAGTSGCLGKEVGSAERASPTRFGASGSGVAKGSSSEMVGVKGVENTETMRKRGDIGLKEMSPAKIGKELRLTTLVSSRPGKKVAATEPIQLRVY